MPSARLLAVWVPDWPIVALTLESAAGSGPGGTRLPDPGLTPVAVVGGRGVQAASAPARRSGVRVGMRLRVARSLCPGLVVLHPQPDREARAFETVMDSLSGVLADPLVARPGLALSSARGPARWLGGEEALAAALVEAVAEDPGAECQVGVADSLLGAVLAARRGVIVPEGRTPEFLAPWSLDSVLSALPTRRAREDARDLLETLARLGLRSLGDLAALPRRDVTARFGSLGERIHRLACGDVGEVPRQSRPATDLAVETRLDPPVERSDAAAFAARSLAEELSARLLARGLAAGRMVVEAQCDNGAALSRSWLLETTPTAAELTDRVRWQLEGWLAGRSGRPPAAPLVGLRLSALELVGAGSSQAGLWTAPGEQGRRRAVRAVDRVESLLGAGSVLVPRLVPGRDPRSRSRLVAWGEQTEDLAAEDAPWQGSLIDPSPSLVPARPVPAGVFDGEGQELSVDAGGSLSASPRRVHVDAVGSRSGRRGGWMTAVDGWDGDREVVSWAGPWPVDEGWWRPGGPSRRAYLQVVVAEGPPLLLVRSTRWWLDGVYA